MLRDIAAKQVLKQQPVSDPNEKLRIELELLTLDYKEAIDERESWQALAQEEQAKRLERDVELERFKEENRRLDAKAAALEHNLNAASPALIEPPKITRPLKSYDDLEDWADEVLGERVYIHQASLKDCKKHGHDNMLGRISAALIVIRDYVVPARIHGGLDQRALANAKLTELGMEDTSCFVDRDEAKRTPGYSVSYDGVPQVLYDHIKYGNGYDNANQIRIYYFWDERRKRFVVGKMPTHLRNNLTN